MDKKLFQEAFEKGMRITERHLDDFKGTESKGGFPAPASENNRYPMIDNNDWTAGFYTGILWMCYEYSGREVFKDRAMEQIKSFRYRIDHRVVVDHHDMGFIYSLSCVAAYKLTGDEFAKETALLAADNLKSRFREKGQFIQAWGELDTKENYRLIIDCLLNLPILYWASEVTGDASYRECALKHLETTRKVIFRPDYSTYHTYYFDMETGEPAYGATKQGYSDESTWSRGQSWGVYGLMLNYMYEKADGIPEEWKKVTDYFLAHLPEDKAAYWDFYFMDGPEPRDSSASAIAVCGILEAYKQGVCGEDYLEKAYEILASLAENYAAPENDEVNGLLLHSTYGRLLGDGIDECCLWGDYFYMEALMRVIRPEWKPYW